MTSPNEINLSDSSNVSTDMTTIEFFEYLAAHDSTRAIALLLADAWTAQEVGDENVAATAAA